MKRSFALFVVLIFMVSAMCLPVFAAESYIFQSTGSCFGTGSTDIPSGYYNIRVYYEALERTLVGYTIEPFYFIHSEGTYLIPADTLIVADPASGDLVSSPFDFFLRCDGDTPPELELFFWDGQSKHFYDGEGYSLEMIPVDDEIAVGVLLSVVNSDMLSGVLGQIVALLPVALGALIAFVGIRKGINFLQQIMRTA